MYQSDATATPPLVPPPFVSQPRPSDAISTGERFLLRLMILVAIAGLGAVFGMEYQRGDIGPKPVPVVRKVCPFGCRFCRDSERGSLPTGDVGAAK
jgi:hypothetical protein